MEGGSLEAWLDRPGGGQHKPLAWQDRVRICCEVASALQHLQTRTPPIVHLDVKPSNVLLDAALRARLGDVGIAGDLRYVDPEYLRSGGISKSSDVFSLGITMLQVVAGTTHPDAIQQAEDAVEATGAGGPDAAADFDLLVDPSAGGWPRDEALAFARLALSCCQPQRRMRPTLGSEVLPALARLAARAAAATAAANAAAPSVVTAAALAAVPAAALAPVPAAPEVKEEQGQQQAAVAMTTLAATEAGVQLLNTTVAKARSEAVEALAAAAKERDEAVEALSGMEDTFCCPILHAVMDNPVVAADGYTYERSAITTWLADRSTSPMTRERLASSALVPNRALRAAITEWRQAHAAAVSPRRPEPQPPQAPASPAVPGSADAAAQHAAQLLAHGADASGVRPEDRSAGLGECCRQGRAEAARVLIAAGADVNLPESGGFTPLMCASLIGHTDVVQLLLKSGARAGCASDLGSNALNFSCSKGHAAVARLLIAAGAHVNRVNGYRSTPLMAAASGGHLEVAQLLLDCGADVNMVNPVGSTALSIATDPKMHRGAPAAQQRVADLLRSRGAR